MCDVFQSSPVFPHRGDESFVQFRTDSDYKELMKRKGYKATGDLFAEFSTA